MKTLITGGAGFMGRVLAPKLLNRGHSVCSLLRDRSRVENLRSLPIKVSYGDLADLESLTTACRGTDVVFHTAAFATHWGKWRDYWHANVVGTRNVLEAMAVSGVKRLIHFSSFAVYGYQNGLRSEETPCSKSGDFYSDSKVEAECIVRDLARHHGIDVTILRPGVIYGPGDPKWIPTVSHNIRSGRMRVIGSGEHIAPIVYGDDVAECAIECSCHPRAVGEVFNIVSDDNVTWRQFLEMLAFHLGTRLPRFGIPYGFIYPAAAVMEVAWRLAHARYPPPATRFGLRLLASDWRSDSQKARKVIGFSPKVSYVEGLKATVEWIENRLASRHSTGQTGPTGRS